MINDGKKSKTEGMKQGRKNEIKEDKGKKGRKGEKEGRRGGRERRVRQSKVIGSAMYESLKT